MPASHAGECGISSLMSMSWARDIQPLSGVFRPFEQPCDYYWLIACTLIMHSGQKQRRRHACLLEFALMILVILLAAKLLKLCVPHILALNYCCPSHTVKADTGGHGCSSPFWPLFNFHNLYCSAVCVRRTSTNQSASQRVACFLDHNLHACCR